MGIGKIQTLEASNKVSEFFLWGNKRGWIYLFILYVLGKYFVEKNNFEYVI